MSVLNLNYKVLFVHNPKVAGSSMEQREFLGGCSHMPIWMYQQEVVGLENIFSFAFVRHPLDRFVSAFFHEPNITGFDKDRSGFEAFVNHISSLDLEHPGFTYPTLSNWPIHHHFLPQWFFICDKSGKVAVDFLGRFEALQHDWGEVCSVVGVPSHLGHFRKTDRAHYQNYYDSETERIVRNIYHRDFELFYEEEL